MIYGTTLTGADINSLLASHWKGYQTINNSLQAAFRSIKIPFYEIKCGFN